MRALALAAQVVRGGKSISTSQLALYRERGAKPRRVDAATRVALALLSRWFDWRSALVIVRPENVDWLASSGLPVVVAVEVSGAGSSRTEIYKYTECLLRVTGSPRIVIPTQWDNFVVPYENKAAQVMARKEKADPFVAEVAAASPQSRTIIPVHLETITVRNGALAAD